VYPDRHGLRVKYPLCHIILYSRFPIHDRTLRARNWEHGDMGIYVPGSTRVEFPLDVFGQARDAVWVSPGARQAETE